MLVSEIENKIKKLGLTLPERNTLYNIANYVPALVYENQIFVSGQLPIKEGKIIIEGQMDEKRDLSEAQYAMSICFINGLSLAMGLLKKENEIKGILRLVAFVSSKEKFYDQHLVANGASNLAIDIFGEEGYHTRSAVGVSALPKNSTVELEIIFKLK